MGWDSLVCSQHKWVNPKAKILFLFSVFSVQSSWCWFFFFSFSKFCKVIIFDATLILIPGLRAPRPTNPVTLLGSTHFYLPLRPPRESIFTFEPLFEFLPPFLFGASISRVQGCSGDWFSRGSRGLVSCPSQWTLLRGLLGGLAHSGPLSAHRSPRKKSTLFFQSAGPWPKSQSKYSIPIFWFTTTVHSKKHRFTAVTRFFFFLFNILNVVFIEWVYNVKLSYCWVLN